jgi:threonyl-tRNA synthetase
MPIKVTLPDGKPLELADGATGADAAAAIGPGLARAALAVEVSRRPQAGDGEAPEVRDLARPLPDGAGVAIVTKQSGERALELIRHDAAHVLAAAVMELYPGVKISIGPPIEQGFYYDFEFPEGTVVSEAQLPRIEERMRAHVKAAEAFERRDVTPEQARERFVGEGQDYKVELIDDLVTAARARGEELPSVSLYTNGPFTDLCRGPHAPSTKSIGAFKLQSVAGAYWRGDSTRTMLTRIYGTAFHSKAELAEHLERLEQARARDHRKLGRELDLFTFSEVSPGAAFWLGAGTRLWNKLVAVSREMGAERGYTEVKTPLIYDAELWKTSGHWGKYRENMFIAVDADGEEMGAVKPMNCPGHAHLFASRRHSYRDLPVRYSEPGLLHRNEASGVLHGLLRARHFAQDDAHIFCTEEQVQREVAGCLELAFATYKLFDLDVRLELSTRPRERIGDDEMWDRAEGALTMALDEQGLPYELNPGDGAFYGPKIDMHMTDSIGRSWQLGTVQLD